MTRALKLSLPTSDFDDLWAAADGRGKSCRVPKAALTALLIDHSRALARLTDMGEQFEEPEFEEPMKNHPKVREAGKDSS